MGLMRDYSAEAFKMAMTLHFYRYGTPCVLTADNGSQIRKSAGDGEAVQTGDTSSSVSDKDSGVARGEAEPGVFNWCRGARGWLKDTIVYLAPTERHC